MKILLLLWRVLLNVVEIGVILAMFHVAKSPFETVVVSALVLIYTSLTGAFAVLANSLLQKGNQDLARFIEIAKSLRLETELYEEALNEDRESFQKIQVSYSISAVFRALIFFLAVGNLIFVVLS